MPLMGLLDNHFKQELLSDNNRVAIIIRIAAGSTTVWYDAL
jgi:hypothetical protein